MYRVLDGLKHKLTLVENKNFKLDKFIGSDHIKMFIDYREKANHILRELIDFGVDIKLDKLESGDYILSSRVGVEFKTIKDFVDSLIGN